MCSKSDKALAAVHRLHERIRGELPEAAGAHPAGSAYSAFDPELMLWTLAVIADSGRAMYETMVRPLRRGRNNYFFNVVTAAEKQRGGTPTPPLTHRTASDFHPAR